MKMIFLAIYASALFRYQCYLGNSSETDHIIISNKLVNSIIYNNNNKMSKEIGVKNLVGKKKLTLSVSIPSKKNIKKSNSLDLEK